MTTPLVSVIIPALNQEQYIADALTSLRFQGIDLDALEVIVINDGSTDGTTRVVEEFHHVFPRLTTLHNVAPQGVSAARNRGTRHATGTMLAYLDPDDWFGPHYLRQCADAMRRLSVEFVRTDHTRQFSGHREVWYAPESRRDRVLNPLDGVTPVHYSTMLDYPYPCTGLFHASLKERGLLTYREDLHTAEDREMIWRVHLHAENYAVLSTPDFFYRRDLTGSLTSAFTPMQLDFTESFAIIASEVERAHASGRLTDTQHHELSLKRARQFLSIALFHRERLSDQEGENHGDLLNILATRVQHELDTDTWMVTAVDTLDEERQANITTLLQSSSDQAIEPVIV